MKSTFFSLFVLAFLFVSCGQTTGEEATTEDAVAIEEVASAETYNIDASQSNLEWEGTKLVGEGHVGTINVQGGSLEVEGGNIMGGKLMIDMASLTSTDLDGEGLQKLNGHLMSPDFFNVEKYPTATFEIASATPVDGQEGVTHEIKGNLTMKDQTKAITFPAGVQMMDGKIMATSPAFTIDRTDWGIVYGAEGSVADLAKDKTINKEIGLKLNLVAMK
ncbi:MAG: YceI family protein [Saprospiraceae bacterium]